LEDIEDGEIHKRAFTSVVHLCAFDNDYTTSRIGK
jgi:hypothetical protein